MLSVIPTHKAIHPYTSTIKAIKAMLRELGAYLTERKSDKTKNQRLLDMFDRAIKNQVKFDYVLADSWFSAKATFKPIRKANKHFIFALKSNRLVALTEDDRQKGNFVRIDESNLPDNTPVRGFLNDYHDEVLLLRRVFTNKDGSTGVLYSRACP